MKKITIIILLLICSVSYAHIDTLRLASYNLLGFPGTTGEQRIPYFRVVMKTLNPDILVVQEMLSQEGVNAFLNDVLNYSNDSYSAAPFVNGYDTDNALFYKKAKFRFISNRQINTVLRDISEYTLTYKNNSTAPPLKIYSCHLKASTGTDNEQKRLAEATILRNELNKLPTEAEFFVCGDFNVYTSTEPAYQMLTEFSYDPINRSGNWHNNSSFANIHTQSTQTTQFGGGANGGMDDRFDFILVSDDLLDLYVTDSYAAFGNDGRHFNTLPNLSVADSIADALYYASDHWPVFLDFTISTESLCSNATHIYMMGILKIGKVSNRFTQISLTNNSLVMSILEDSGWRMTNDFYLCASK